MTSIKRGQCIVAVTGVSILTMIYYAWAQLHWTWIWYVAVILFGLFEKKRANMIGFVEGLRKWQ